MQILVKTFYIHFRTIDVMDTTAFKEVDGNTTPAYSIVLSNRPDRWDQ